MTTALIGLLLIGLLLMIPMTLCIVLGLINLWRGKK